ncbi:hypothetical protein T484DRAFT_2139882 [Baffinella frigidus]|nr:hypothetical protein T484DRAFT_2139882 [Cryptophyta sp. CCMP2293]
MGLLALVLRVTLTFALAVIFLLAGVNKTSPDFHRPTYLFLVNLFPECVDKVWRPLLTRSLDMCFSVACGFFSGFGAALGREGEGESETFKVTGSIAAKLTSAGLMRAVGLVEMWCAMFLLISLAGTGSRGHRVPLAEISNVVLLVLMAAATYTHMVLKDGHFIAPAALGMLLLLRLVTPPPKSAPLPSKGGMATRSGGALSPNPGKAGGSRGAGSR